MTLEAPALVLGKPAQTPAHGQPGLRLLVYAFLVYAFLIYAFLVYAFLVYVFLLSLLTPALAPLVQEILRHWRHRTGEERCQVAVPLSRLRSALNSLWLTHLANPSG